MILAAPAAVALAAAPDPTTALRAKDQALLDSIAGGGRKLWDATLAPGAIYVDENGRVLDRATLLKEMEPLGPGASGAIAITDHQASFVGDLALVVHTDEEHEAYHGQPLGAEIADVLFDPTQLRDRKLFQRDAGGHIVGFVDRRDGGDITWRRQGSG